MVNIKLMWQLHDGEYGQEYDGSQAAADGVKVAVSRQWGLRLRLCCKLLVIGCRGCARAWRA